MLSLFELVNSAHVILSAELCTGREKKSWAEYPRGTGLQFLEVAVCDVVAAPVRNSVELDAVGELHLVLVFEPTALLDSLRCPARFLGLGFAPELDVPVIGELVLIVVGCGVSGKRCAA